MSGWDAPIVSSVNLDLANEPESASLAEKLHQVSRSEVQSKFRQFLRGYRPELYRDQLKDNYSQGEYYLNVRMDDLQKFDPHLSELLIKKPSEYMPVFEEAAVDCLALTSHIEKEKLHPIQIQLTHYGRQTPIRGLSSSDVSQLVFIRGMIVNAGKVRLKSSKLALRCRNCGTRKMINVAAGFGMTPLPRQCDSSFQPNRDANKCPLDPYRIIPDLCVFSDQQRMKIQENPEDVPTGEMPRSIGLSVEGKLVGKVKPGTRVGITAIFTTYNAKARDLSRRETKDIGIRLPYLRVLGIEQDAKASEQYSHFTPEEEQEMYNLSRTDDLYNKMALSLAPAIFGLEDIKKALLCQLFGGSRKVLPDGMKLRGDINILLLGDPSVAKSQLLKFVSQVAPIAFYTSGKGSSAAGLTASVVRDSSSGEFHLEGGALVLADGGIVCIDEFDKMRAQDRVAIHEAMEQQTISIAKAGITTILNSRTAVLAAANPVFGRYDDMKSPSENIEFQSSILSRFDMIFIVRDVQDAKRDAELVRHVVSVNRQRDRILQNDLIAEDSSTFMPINKLKRYLAYCRNHCFPRMEDEAAKQLKNEYLQFREDYRKKKMEGKTPIPITVRQLEAIIRISEAVARIHLSPVARAEHMKEALRLFRISTYSAAISKYSSEESGSFSSPEFFQKVKMAEQSLKRRIAIGMKVSFAKLLTEVVACNHEENVVRKAIDIMKSRNQLQFIHQGKMIERLR